MAPRLYGIRPTTGWGAGASSPGRYELFSRHETNAERIWHGGAKESWSRMPSTAVFRRDSARRPDKRNGECAHARHEVPARSSVTFFSALPRTEKPAEGSRQISMIGDDRGARRTLLRTVNTARPRGSAQHSAPGIAGCSGETELLLDVEECSMARSLLDPPATGKRDEMHSWRH